MYQSQVSVRPDRHSAAGPAVLGGARTAEPRGEAAPGVGLCSESTAVDLAGARLVRAVDTAQECEEAQVTQEGQRGYTHPSTLWRCLLKVSPTLDKTKVPSSHQEHVCWILFYPISARQNQIAL